MNKIGLVIQREYLTRVRKKSFIIMTLLGPFILAAFYGVIIFLAVQEPDMSKIVLVDETEQLQEYLSTDQDNVEWNFEKPMTYEEALNIYRNDSKYKTKDFLVWIPKDIIEDKYKKPKLVYRNTPSTQTEMMIRRNISRAREKRLLQKRDIDAETYEDISAGISLEIFNNSKIDSTGKEVETQADYKAAGFVGMILSFLIFMFIFMYGVQVMRGVIEEKTNRIVEVIISSVKPFSLMMGKVIGVALVGLTQFAIWVLLSGVLITIIMSVVGASMGATTDMAEMQQNLEPGIQTEVMKVLYGLPWMEIVISFVFFFLGGYLLYSSIFAAIGSAVDSETDTQQFMFPVIIPLLLGFYVAQFSIFSDPNGILMQICSYIPFTSPVVMLMRISMDTVSFWEILLSLVILFGSFILTTWVAAKIYRTGILMYGKKASYKELFKWIKHG